MARYGARTSRRRTNHIPSSSKSVRVDGVTYPTQAAAIVALTDAGKTSQWIANRLKIHPKAIYTAQQKARDFSEIEARVPEGKGRAIRTCLTCGRDFDSEWIGNRMCRDCKASTKGGGIAE